MNKFAQSQNQRFIFDDDEWNVYAYGMWLESIRIQINFWLIFVFISQSTWFMRTNFYHIFNNSSRSLNGLFIPTIFAELLPFLFHFFLLSPAYIIKVIRHSYAIFCWVAVFSQFHESGLRACPTLMITSAPYFQELYVDKLSTWSIEAYRMSTPNCAFYTPFNGRECFNGIRASFQFCEMFIQSLF